MKIALFGYGKMGKMIEELATKKNHTIIAKINADQTDIDFSNIDVAIDFSQPSAAFNNIKLCLENNTPIISGTTGWLDKYDDAVALCNENNGGFIYASNFSLGVNLFFELNEYLAKMMTNLRDYNVSMEEIHHTQKLDAPSGTAITLAEGVIKNTSYTGWSLENPKEHEIKINAVREGQVPGTHIVDYKSDVDSIEIKHTADNREGFALGAIAAAEWLIGKHGVFNMKDVLHLR
ncbi:4-hydroxy-tetrahydrodipicolinate reductase [Cellulophaga sp. HaHaR_3_176]|uniref:4-hydroxy-tetrahydrodipicolinate reductase n=1 Tax=Cellulophaga sp. HaHaR_3_176 TaxID=1942464 RepID=UPI001C1FF32B|nr:4-hydroxy-tetrahydrodipicolinate reductase [Cellulophaga sp. HaHaR_3_176]QWX85620.1 4-hydroxy-tetrahydrodipicolinate reductase [Cellulophaga sp. HaHaR_3_176]